MQGFTLDNPPNSPIREISKAGCHYKDVALVCSLLNLAFDNLAVFHLAFYTLYLAVVLEPQCRGGLDAPIYAIVYR
jgi:hypothetical protein